jgi:hypothetical protein
MGGTAIIRPGEGCAVDLQAGLVLAAYNALLNSTRRFSGTFPPEQDSLNLHVA